MSLVEERLVRLPEGVFEGGDDVGGVVGRGKQVGVEVGGREGGRVLARVPVVHPVERQLGLGRHLEEMKETSVQNLFGKMTSYVI